MALLVTGALVAAIIAGTGERTPSARSAEFDEQSYCARFAGTAFVAAAAQAHTGRYSNPVYGYAVTIPTGLTGYTPATGAMRGITIPLSSKPSAWLRVDAAYDALYDITATGVHTRDSVDVRLFDRLLSEQSQPYTLAGVQGGRYRMQVLCRGHADPTLFESIVVVRRREIYRLDLQTQMSRLSQDQRTLDAMARSWSWSP